MKRNGFNHPRSNPYQSEFRQEPITVPDDRPADELDVPAVLVGDHAPSVVLLFVGPAVAVEGLINLDRLHRGDLR